MNQFSRASALIIIKLILLTLFFSGCRMGNYKSPTPDNPDKISGYYETLPQSLKFCATSANNTQCVNTSTGEIPSLLSSELTNPTALIVQDLATGDAVFTSPYGGKTALPVWINADKSLYFTGSAGASVLWDDPGCTSKLYLTQNGAITPGGGTPVTATRKTQGRIQLQVTVTQVFEGTACDASLQKMSDCYQNVNLCGAASSSDNLLYQEVVQKLFDAYIKANAMTAADIPNIRNLGYEVQYQ